MISRKNAMKTVIPNDFIPRGVANHCPNMIIE